MQHSLKLLALLTAAALPALALADFAGLPFPFTIAAEYGLYTYGAAFAVLLALRDYARAPRKLRVPAPLLLPAREAFVHGAIPARPSARRRAFRAPQCL